MVSWFFWWLSSWRSSFSRWRISLICRPPRCVYCVRKWRRSTLSIPDRIRLWNGRKRRWSYIAVRGRARWVVACRCCCRCRSWSLYSCSSRRRSSYVTRVSFGRTTCLLTTLSLVGINIFRSSLRISEITSVCSVCWWRSRIFFIPSIIWRWRIPGSNRCRAWRPWCTWCRWCSWCSSTSMLPVWRITISSLRWSQSCRHWSSAIRSMRINC